MRLLIITPTSFPTISGNAIDVDRITRSLNKYVKEIKIVTPDKINITEIKKFKPDIIHAFHAFKSSNCVKLAKEFNIPFVLTLTGTDYNQDIKNKDKEKIILDTINKSSAITVFSNKTKKVISKQFPIIKNKVYKVRRDKPILKSKKWKFKSEYKINENDFVFTLIAGIRLVKNNIFPIKPLKKLHDKHNNVKFIIVGPILDENYFLKIKKEIENQQWIKYIGSIPQDKIKQVYQDSNVIINCSHSEGLSNVIFEAMYLGKAILVSNIPGNKFLVKNNISCLSYKHDNEEESYEKALKLYENKNRLKKISINAKKKALNMINQEEAKEYYVIYKKVINEYEEHTK
jgi:L-malate glycosyltransferase